MDALPLEHDLAGMAERQERRKVISCRYSRDEVEQIALHLYFVRDGRGKWS